MYAATKQLMKVFTFCNYWGNSLLKCIIELNIYILRKNNCNYCAKITDSILLKDSVLQCSVCFPNDNSVLEMSSLSILEKTWDEGQKNGQNGPNSRIMDDMQTQPSEQFWLTLQTRGEENMEKMKLLRIISNEHKKKYLNNIGTTCRTEIAFEFSR